MISDKLKNQSGVALILVLTSLMIMTTLVVEFAYNTHVTYEVAANQRDRLRAYYLARSALNFLRLELYVERKFKVQFANVLSQLKDSGITSAPLCAQIPLSTGMLRSVASGGNPFESKDEGEKAKDEGEKKFDTFEGLSHDQEGFLDFEGDFEAHCSSEEQKVNMNIFRPVSTLPGFPQENSTPPAEPGSAPAGLPATPLAGAQAQYETQKGLLLSILSQPDFDAYFDDTESRRKLANAIADWVDANDRINEAPGVEGSAEDSEYNDLGVDYKVKNGRFASLEEMLLVAGMTDDIFAKLKDLVTIYGDQKINLCEAQETTVRAFVTQFASGSGMVIDPKDEERWGMITASLTEACGQPNPQPAQIASVIMTALGALTQGANQPSAQNLANQITTTDRFYTLEGSGTAGETEVKLREVLDTANSNPVLWKTLYFREE